MDEKTYQLEIIEQLAGNEEMLSQLYSLYQHKFPSRSEFWNGLVEDEQGHAQWIRTLRKRVEEGEIHIKEHRFNIDMINDFNSELRRRQLEITENDIPLGAALENAVDFEKTMIERKFFEVFEDDTPELQILLLALKYSTENHFAAIAKALAEER
jgi:hypothetical protein